MFYLGCWDHLGRISILLLKYNSFHVYIYICLFVFRRKPLDEPHDACRVHGSLTLNKVSGNFHIAAGKSVPLMRGHAHLTTLFDDNEANFSHRIDRFSFGDPHGSIIQPLEGDEKVTDNGNSNNKSRVIPRLT